jgi:hypothetical protein
MLTVKCPNCGQLMGIKELFVGGRNLIYSGLRMLDNCASLIGDQQEYGHGDEEDLHTMNELNMLKRIVRTLLKELPNEVDIGDLDERSREWISKEREQDSYFERNPNSTLGKGNVHGQM